MRLLPGRYEAPSWKVLRLGRSGVNYCFREKPLADLLDLWDGCYDGQARSIMSPEDFRQKFCGNCMNSGCRNSRGSGMSWVQRISTQRDRLLDNPRFAELSDPRFQEFAQMEFQDRLREALAIEISDQKGDWSIPTSQEVGTLAASVIGLVPAGFQTAPPEEDNPQPPERLVDEVTLSNKPDPIRPVLRLPQDPPRMRGQNDLLVQMDDPQDPPPQSVEGSWKIKGSSGNTYQVTLFQDQTWDCTCPSRENPCKHAQIVQGKMKRAAQTPVSEAPKMPLPAPRKTGTPPRGNTQVPSGGVLLGGVPHQEHDPWAPSPQKEERKVPVGGRVRFGTKK
jgi:hypothetical protein